jgi:hypothetical protein
MFNRSRIEEESNSSFRTILVIVAIVAVLVVLFIAFQLTRTQPSGASGSILLVQDLGPDVVVPPSTLERLSWGAVLAGSVIALILQLALNLLGISVGATSITPRYDEDSPEAGEVASSAAIWVGVSTLIAMFAGGWVAARFAGIPDNVDGLLHGLMVWGIVTLISLFLLTTTIGRIISGVSTLIGHGLNLAGRTVQGVAQGVGNVAQGVAQGVGGAVQDVAANVTDTVQHAVDSSPEVANALEGLDLSFEGIVNEAQMLLQQAGLSPENMRGQAQGAMNDAQTAVRDIVQNPARIDQTVNLALRRMFRRGQAVVSDADRDAFVQLMMERSNMTEEQARQSLGRWEQSYNMARQELEQAQEKVRMSAERIQAELKEKAEEARHEAERVAREAAQATTKTVAKVAGAVFLAILVGAIAAGLGGLIGAPEVVPTAEIDTTSYYSQF